MSQPYVSKHEDSVIVGIDLPHLTIFAHADSPVQVRTFQNHRESTRVITPKTGCKLVNVDGVWGEKTPSCNIHIDLDIAYEVLGSLAAALDCEVVLAGTTHEASVNYEILRDKYEAARTKLDAIEEALS